MTEPERTKDNPMDSLEPIGDTKISSAHGVAAVALSLAMKFHDINTVQDGALYQQYKLEGKNLTPLQLDVVFETAIRIERHLLASSDRIAQLIVDAIRTEEEPPEPSDHILAKLNARIARLIYDVPSGVALSARESLSSFRFRSS